MKTLKYISAILLTTFIGFNANAQTRVISGQVNGINGAIEGAEVTIEKQTVTTNNEGKFSIEAPLNKVAAKVEFKRMEATKMVESDLNNFTVVLVPKEKKLFKAIDEEQQIRLCDIYLDYYPNGKNIDKVNSIKEKQIFIKAYDVAASQFSDTALQNYLKLYPDGQYKQKALDAIEIAAWQKARYENTVDAYQKYINKYPNGKATELAKKKIADLK